jgi:hypothetical protein
MTTQRDPHAPGIRRGLTRLALAFALTLGAAACGSTYIANGPSDPNGGGSGGGGNSGGNNGGSGGNNGNPGSGGSPTVTTTVDVGTVNNAVDNGARATVDLTNANQQQQGQQQQVAQQVTLDNTQTDKDESVQGAIGAIDKDHGTLTLDVLAVIISFDEHTQFVDTTGQQVTLAAFVTFVQTELQAGRKPGVDCRRKAKKPAQAPHDAEFLAVTIVLQAAPPPPVIDCNIDKNAVAESSGQVVIIVLDVVIVLENGHTVLVLPAGTTAGAPPTCTEKATGLIAAVDVPQGKVQLADGTTIMIATTTHILAMGEDDLDSDHEDEMEAARLTSLADVGVALAAGRKIEAEAQGCLAAAGPPRVVTATQVAFEVGS